jgi:GTP-binding protein HflX
MFEVREKPNMVQRALLVGVYFDKAEEAEAQSLLEELYELVSTLHIGIIETMLIRVREGNKAGFLTGRGKMAEVIAHAKELECDCIIFDNALTPSQQRNWEKAANVAVIDRQEVILDIFSMRARTREARLQVQLARMKYSLPRLTRMWGHLDRQGGSGGAARGEGEKQIEVDRRLARKRIDRVKEELAEVVRQRDTQRKERVRLPVPHAAIVGYTNAGKSSLLNTICGSDAFVEDKVFATLDTTTRRVELPDGQELLLTDTVGFVRRLPHGLVESFKATLEEAVIADFLIHVIDGSAPDVYEHYQTTMDVLKELGADDQRVIVAVNKTDLIEGDASRMHELELHLPGAVFISVKTGQGIETLLHRMTEMLFDRIRRLDLRVPQARMDLVTLIHREGKILSQEYDGNDILVRATVPASLASRFEDFIEPSPSEAAKPLAK